MKKGARVREALSFLAINLAGCMIYAAAIQVFTKPYQIAPGGVAGLATIFNYLFHLPIGALSLAMNVPLLLLSWFYISHDFTIRTTISTVIFSVCTDYLVTWLPEYPSQSALAPLLAAVFGGALMGVGNALVYMGHSTTGGTSIIGALLQKAFPQFSMGKMLSLSNLLVVAASMLAFRNIETAVFAFICIYVSGFVMDRLIYGFNTNRLLFIISNRSAEIEAKILVDLHRGVTVLKGEGGYGHTRKNVIFCVVSRAQFPKVREIAMQVDPDAFIVGCEAGDVLGKGFKHLD